MLSHVLDQRIRASRKLFQNDASLHVTVSLLTTVALVFLLRLLLTVELQTQFLAFEPYVQPSLLQACRALAVLRVVFSHKKTPKDKALALNKIDLVLCSVPT